MPLKDIKCILITGIPTTEVRRYCLRSSIKGSVGIRTSKRIDPVIKTKISLVDLSRTPQSTDAASPVSIEEMPKEYLVTSPGIDASENTTFVFRRFAATSAIAAITRLNAGHPYGAMQRTQDLARDKWDQYAFFFTKVPSPVKTIPVCQLGRPLCHRLSEKYDAAHTYHFIYAGKCSLANLPTKRQFG